MLTKLLKFTSNFSINQIRTKIRVADLDIHEIKKLEKDKKIREELIVAESLAPLPDPINIPEDSSSIHFNYSRSQGAGGQHVNTTSSKAELRFFIDKAAWLPDDIKQKFKELNANRITDSGEYLVTSSEQRSAHQNKALTLKKLRDAVREAQVALVKVPRKDFLDTPELVSKKIIRMKIKSEHSKKKADRGKVDF